MSHEQTAPQGARPFATKQTIGADLSICGAVDTENKRPSAILMLAAKGQDKPLAYSLDSWEEVEAVQHSIFQAACRTFGAPADAPEEIKEALAALLKAEAEEQGPTH